MRILLLLRADGGHAGETTLSSAIDVGPEDLRWPGRLAAAIAGRAREGALCLREHLVPAPGPAPRFVPLADVVPALRD
jgi:hypothetical protein